MRDSLQQVCDRYAASRATVQKLFRLDNGYLHAVCANVFCSKGIDADPEAIAASKKLIKENTGIFSAFRGNLSSPLACMLAAAGNPQGCLEQTLETYHMLKEQFRGSEYLALTAFLLASTNLSNLAVDAAARGKVLYRRMKQEHPFLTSSEDCVYAIYMALSEKEDDELIHDMEACYSLLKARFPVSDPLQSVSHILCLAEGATEIKVGRLLSIYDKLRDFGMKYGKYYELPTLAAVSIQTAGLSETATDLLNVDYFLSGLSGYGFLGMDKKTRLMHAAMLVCDDYSLRQRSGGANPSVTPGSYGAQTAAGSMPLTWTLSLLAAQQAAMCAMISSSAAASAASAAH